MTIASYRSKRGARPLSNSTIHCIPAYSKNKKRGSPVKLKNLASRGPFFYLNYTPHLQKIKEYFLIRKEQNSLTHFVTKANGLGDLLLTFIIP